MSQCAPGQECEECRVPARPVVQKPMTLRNRIRQMLITQRVAAKSVEPLPPLRNRGEARKFIRGRGPFMFFGAPKREDNRRVTTRQKRGEQRERVHGRPPSE